MLTTCLLDWCFGGTVAVGELISVRGVWIQYMSEHLTCGTEIRDVGREG